MMYDAFFILRNPGKTYFFGKAILFLILFNLFIAHSVFCQSYTLSQIIDYAQKNSPEALRIETAKENKYWQWRTYKSNYKPQLVLNSDFPYQNKNIPVSQNDGSIVYRRVNQSEATVDVSLEQNISLTGGKLYLSSDLSRADNFDENTHSYSSSPFYIGIEQPIFSFNELKWMNKIEPLKYEESQRSSLKTTNKLRITRPIVFSIY